MFTNFEYITYFSCLNKRNISISIKQFCTVMLYLIIYITRTDFEHHFSQLFRVRVVLSRWTYYKKFYFAETRKNVIYSKLVNNHFNKYFLKNEKLWFTRLFHLKIYLQFPFLTCVSYACLISV